MFRLALSTLRFRKGGFVATFVALFVGTVIVMACGGMMESGIRSTITPQRLAAAPIVVSGNQSYTLSAGGGGRHHSSDTETATLTERVRLPLGLADKIRKVPGVAKVVPDVSFPAQIVGDEGAVSIPGTEMGHSWTSAELAPYTLAQGKAPEQSGQIVLDASTAARTGTQVGSTVQVAVRAGAKPFQVVGIATSSTKMASDALFFSPADTGKLVSQPNKVDSFGVLPAAGADLATVQAAVDNAVHSDGAIVLTGDARGPEEFTQAQEGGEILIILSAVFGGLAVQVAMFVVASTLGLSVQQRRREIALLRAIGTTPQQLSRMITGEAMVVGVLATALAVVPGQYVGRWLFDQLGSFGVFEPVLKFQLGPLPIAAAILVGLASAWGAAFVAARYAAMTRPVEALQEITGPTRWLTSFRIWGGIGSLITAAILAYVTVAVLDGPLAASTAGPAVTMVAIAVALFAPGITKALISVVSGPVRALTGLGGYLAMLNAKARWLQMAGAVIPIMLATGLATFMLYFQTTQVNAAQESYSANLLADAVVTSSTENVSPQLVDSVRKLPGVAGASAFVTSTGYVEKPVDREQDEDGVELQGVTADGIQQTRHVDVTTGDLANLNGNTIALSTTRAARLNLKVGDEMTMRLGDDTRVNLSVVATFAVAPDFESAIMPASTLAPHTASGMVTQMLVKAAPGTTTTQLSQTLDGLTKDKPGLQVADRDRLTAAYVQQEQGNAWVNYLVVGMILLYAAISVVNTLVMATANRRREFGLQRLTGTTRGQVLRMVGVEALVVAVIGCLLGTVVAASMLIPFSAAVSNSFIPSGPLWIYLAILALAAVLTVGATVVPTWLAIRNRTSATVLAPE